MTCIQAYLTAKAAAEQQLENTLATCTSDACRDDAVEAYSTAIKAARDAYFACRAGGGGGGGT